MGNRLSSTYEFIRSLGSGGGARVYLARHRGMRKLVAIKIDKRSAEGREEKLRREVDILKNLDYFSIPKVQDYFIEDGLSYTVLSYIEGESLDKPLKNGSAFSQSEVVKIAAQVLAALRYLHTFPREEGKTGYLHGDIKPSNIMRRPDGSIVLIDFNIALFLGDEKAVGISPGYSSPEHYGLDYSSYGYVSSFAENTTDTKDKRRDSTGSGGKDQSSGHKTETVDLTEDSPTLDTGTKDLDERARPTGESTQTLQNTAERKERVVPDVRSDIYMVGATLYHLLSGKIPARKVLEVTPLDYKKFSPELVRIIIKAMQPNPDLRYQSADEMLQDILHIHENDPRSRRLRRISCAIMAATAVLLIAGCICSYIGLHRIQVREKRLKLTEYARTAFDEGDVKLALNYLNQIYAHEDSVITPSPDPQSQEVLTDVLGVYDLKEAFKPYDLIELSREPQKLILSPDARSLAITDGKELSIYDTSSLALVNTLETEPSVLSEAVFLDSDTILFAGKDGIAAYEISKDSMAWTGDHCTSISVSGNGTRAAAVYKNETFAALYDARNGRKIGTFSFHGRSQNILLKDEYISPEGNLFALNEDGTSLAASFEDGSLSIINVSEEADDKGNDNRPGSAQEINLIEAGSDYQHFEGGFAGKYLSFSAASDTETVFGVINTEEWMQTAGTKTQYYISTSSDGRNIYACDGNYLVALDPESGDQTPLTDTSYNIRRFSCRDGNTIISTGKSVQVFDKSIHEKGHFRKNAVCNRIDISKDIAVVGSSDSKVVNLMKYTALDYGNNQCEKIGTYDPYYEHDEMRVNADESRFMLFSNDGFRIYDRSGRIIREHRFSEMEKSELYDQKFIREGTESFLKVSFYDGKTDIYDGEDGTFIRTDYEDAPDESLDMNIETESYVFDIPLHGKMTVASKKNRKTIAEIEEDAYVTYVTEIQEGVVIQYMTEDRSFYGVLLDRKGRRLAVLNGLRDVKDNYFYFDYGDGSVCKEKVQTLQELTAILREKTGGEK